jgi:sarcosine oxidase delta subunit
LNISVEGSANARATATALLGGATDDSTNSLAIWNATFVPYSGTENVHYDYPANILDLSQGATSAQFTIKFIPTSSTVLLAWGGHIARRIDWGTNPLRSAGGINGSPYHMRTYSWSLNNIGNQDRSLQVALAAPICPSDLFPPVSICVDNTGAPITCPTSVCAGTTLYYKIPDVSGATGYQWSVSPSAGVTIAPNATSQMISVTYANAGSYTVSVQLTNSSGMLTNCNANVNVCGGPSFISPPGNITVACGAIPPPSALSYSNNDNNCLVTGSVTSTQTAAPGPCGGVVTETWSYTPSCGSPISHTRTITVNPAPLPTFSAPPANITVACGTAINPSSLNYSNGGTGNCLIAGSATSTLTATPGACGGVVTETWNATDVCGRALTPVSRRITVSPAALPTMTAPANITVACGAVPTAATITYTNGLSGGCLISGNSDLPSRTSTPGACGGVITETYNATDACGRALAPVSRTITVSPAALPTFSAPPANTTVSCSTAINPSSLSYSNGGSGGCLISGNITSTLTSIPGGCGGVVTETWAGVDACGRTIASVSRTITVSPAALATMTAPANITVACGAVPTAATITYTNGLSGNCLSSGNSNLPSRTATPGACGGVITETWTATDACGRALAPVSRTITVSPAPVPTFATPPANTTVACGAIPAVSSLSYSNGGTGSCLINGSATSTQTAPPNACGGVVTETWSATDACGRTIASVSRTITVSPAALPTMTAPANTTVACGSIPAPITISYTNGLSGGCLINGTSNLSTQTAAPGACGGVVTETWTATDACGRALAPVSRTITVSPAAVPTFSAPPANATVSCGVIILPSALSYSNGGSGNCLISGSITSTLTSLPGACGGVVTETWAGVDACGRTIASVSRVITVSPAALPTMTAPANITVACGAVPTAAAISFTNGLSGNCQITGTSNAPTRTATPNACGGVITETWTATDQCGRALAPVSRTITVQPAPVPVFATPPANTTVACGAIPAVSSLSYSNGGTGSCLISGSATSTQTAPPTACGGVVTETWNATDVCGRTIASVSRTITVSPAALPTMTAPANVTVACGSIPAPITISFSNGLSGGCLINGTSNLSTQTAAPGPCGGVVTETWTATDACGRALAPVSRTITVSPAAVPTFSAAPANTTVACGAIPAVSSLNYSNGGSGNCLIAGAATSTQTAPPGACGGVVTETWAATDACGRALVSVSRTITVSPAALPTMTAPANITVACGAVPTAATISFTNGLSGNCAISGTSNAPTRTATPSACGGVITETWTATDQCGRTIAPVSRTITVSPAPLPVFNTAPANITVACGGVPAVSSLGYSNGQTGGCLISGSATSTQTAIPGACGGVVTETWSATDACGRALVSVSRVITVSPAALPTMTAPANVTVACGQAPAPAAISFTNGLTGGCLISGTSNAPTRTATPGACGGVITETWTATDACGRTIAPVSRTITVQPAAVPTFNAPPANITVACGGVPAPSSLGYTNGGSGNCLISGSATTTLTATPGACGGVVTETWSAQDQCGRTVSSVSRTITVSPAALPTMSAPANITVACGAIPAPSTISYSNGLTGGCLINGTSNLSTQTAAPSACGGVVTETWTATDQCGRTIASVSRRITVSPAPVPTFTSTPANITAQACGVRPSPSSLSYSNGQSGNCAITGTVTSVITGAGECGLFTETWTATDVCGRAIASVSRTIYVNCCTYCTYTQGAYGSAGGMMCNGNPGPNNSYNTIQTIINSLSSYPSGTMRIGTSAKYVDIRVADAQKVIDYLPGGGNSYTFIANIAGKPAHVNGNLSDLNFRNRYTDRVGNGNNPRYKIDNTLLAQTITLGLNIGVRPNLALFQLQAGMYLFVANPGSCGSTTVPQCTWVWNTTTMQWQLQSNPYSSYQLDASVVNALGSNNTVGGLFDLANRALAGEALPAGANLQNIASLVDKINNIFDECKIFVGYSSSPIFCTPPPMPPITSPSPMASVRNPESNTKELEKATKLAVQAFPNPFNDQVRFVIESPVSGQGTLEVFTTLGQKVQVVYQGFIAAGKGQVIDYNVPVKHRTNLIYVLTINGQRVNGKLLNAKD